MEKLRHKFAERLTHAEILQLVEDYKKDIVPEVVQRNDYAKGNNPAILDRVLPSNSPDNKIPISYGRRMINLVTSYMYKPGLITYATEKDDFLQALNPIFTYNDEPLQTEQIGRQASIQGVGYELLYNEGLEAAETLIDKQPGYKATMPRFVKIPVEFTIPIYNFDIEPKLQAFIYFYTIEAEETEYISVYYDDRRYDFKRKQDQDFLIPDGDEEHGFERVPLVVYENNENMIGDFACVVPLIDAYDVLMSDSLNEFDRFAWAYLIMKGLALSDDDLKKAKHKRAFAGLTKDDDITFLTKDINHEFIKFMSEWVRGEIHRQSGIPNLDDYKFGGNTSGETLSKWIYLMELFTDPKESYFKRALKRRVEIIAEYSKLGEIPDDFEIIMSRNAPDKSMEQAELLEKYSGHVTQLTLLENFADFVKDAGEEIEALKAEKEANIAMFPDIDGAEEEEEEDEEE